MLEWGAVLLPLGVLLAPSIWMLSVVPPLWKDIDAYIQVTQPPGTQTILQYGPLYCLVARIPLYLGYAFERLSAGGPISPVAFLLQPTLTDSGVLVLLLSQHLALGSSAFYLIALSSRRFLVRMLLAGIWAANPLFYTFAHCVGSEALSVILLLLLGAMGLRIIRHQRRVSRADWLLLGLLLWLCILTRHLNALLTLLIPTAFLLLSAHWLIMTALTQSKWERRAQRLRARLGARRAGTALAISLCCIVLSNLSLRGLCYAADIPYQFQAGGSFLWRLKFLPTLPPDQADEFLDRVARDTSAPEVKKVISRLREAAHEPTEWESTTLMREAQVSLIGPKSESQRELLPVLNRMVLAFLWPPRDLFVKAIATDFAKARSTTIADINRSLFAHTIFYYSHREAMPGYAALVTFRDRSADEILDCYKRHSFFHPGKRFRYGLVWFLWLALLVILAVVTGRWSRDVAILYYVTALMLIGLAIMLASCLLVEFQPRYTLPMWELTIISMTVAFGRILERRFDSGSKWIGSTESRPTKVE
jgi:hypothetical protein